MKEFRGCFHVKRNQDFVLQLDLPKSMHFGPWWNVCSISKRSLVQGTIFLRRTGAYSSVLRALAQAYFKVLAKIVITECPEFLQPRRTDIHCVFIYSSDIESRTSPTMGVITLYIQPV